ncbi:hypothetical protein [Spirosoma sp.]|uniref:hypothetical protein n=1 Tax=Spirosoma sp. TaxID=1899569 RepID=UPI00263328D0|nr:hypothetical protein [Spirosoma sp.]MCX6216481.1 hypothetical protein [Spirosoma sp.]
MSQTNQPPDRLDLTELITDDLALATRLAHVEHDVQKLSSDVEVIERHYNKPQMRSMLVGANEEYAVWGRGTGKSEGLIAPRSFRNVEVMPRAHGCFVGATYMQLLERTLPPVIKGWEQMGMVRGRDFWIRERPPAKLNIPQPIVGPVTSDHCIFFKNGAVASMVSQDRPGSSNGKTVHWIIGDEAKFLNKPKLDNELLMTNRGDERYFGGIPEFHSLLFCTDMPTTKAAMWILEQEKRMIEQTAQLGHDRVKSLLSIRAVIFDLYDKLLKNPKKRPQILQEIARRQAQWDAIRANTIYFSEASTLDNVHGFGIKNIARLRKQLPPFIFRTAILNQRPFLSENAFYPDLDEHHFTDAYDYGFIDQFEFGQGQYADSRKDADVDKWRPLDIGGDYGSSITPMLVGQPNGRKYRVLNEIYVGYPKKVKDAAKAFCEYYKHHPTKEVRYFYDHTTIFTNASMDISYADDFADVLRAEGWDVNMIYLGHTLSPMQRYEMWGRCLTGGDEKIFDVSFNRNNTQYTRISMQQAQIKQGGRGFEKDKADEKKTEIDQRTTTHFSDGIDTLLIGAHVFHQFESQEAFDAVFVSS